MRKAIPNQTNIQLNPEFDPTQHRSFTVVKELGRGSSCIVYEVKETDTGLRFVLKECFPISNAERQEDGIVLWANPNAEKESKQRFHQAWENQKEILQNDEAVNTNTGLVAGILTGYGTLYILNSLANTKTYAQVKDSNPYETYQTLLALTKALEAYHESGYLHLDLKPQNIMIYEHGTREMVLLLDFGSMVRADQVTLKGLSCTAQYAAPELQQGNVKKICRATDLYSIGAMLFERIFGRTPDCMDCNTFAEWNLEDRPFAAKLSGKARRLTEELLHRTLSASVKHRILDCASLISLLEDLVEESNPSKYYLLSNYPVSTNRFVCRQAELQEIQKLFDAGKKMVFLEGMGGTGKTELALAYAREHKADYDVICFGRFQGSIAEMVSGGSFIQVANSSDPVNFKTMQALCDKHTLLIIDSYDTPDDNGMEELLKLNCCVLITSRLNTSESYPEAGHMAVGSLEAEQQTQLFCLEAGITELSKENQDAIESILKSIDGYTLLIPLIAKQYKNGIRTLSDLSDGIRKAGLKATDDIRVTHRKDKTISDTAYGILLHVLDTSALSEDELFALRSLSMLDKCTIKRKIFIQWIGKHYLNYVNSLAGKSWIQIRGEGSGAELNVHDVIREIANDNYWPTKSEIPWAVKLIEERLPQIIDYIQQLINESEHKEELLWNADCSIEDLEERHPITRKQIALDRKLCESILSHINLDDFETALWVWDYYQRVGQYFIGIECFTSNAYTVLGHIYRKHFAELSENNQIDLLRHIIYAFLSKQASGYGMVSWHLEEYNVSDKLSVFVDEYRKYLELERGRQVQALSELYITLTTFSVGRTLSLFLYLEDEEICINRNALEAYLEKLDDLYIAVREKTVEMDFDTKQRLEYYLQSLHNQIEQNYSEPRIGKKLKEINKEYKRNCYESEEEYQSWLGKRKSEKFKLLSEENEHLKSEQYALLDELYQYGFFPYNYCESSLSENQTDDLEDIFSELNFLITEPNVKGLQSEKLQEAKKLYVKLVDVSDRRAKLVVKYSRYFCMYDVIDDGVYENTPGEIEDLWEMNSNVDEVDCLIKCAEACLTGEYEPAIKCFTQQIDRTSVLKCLEKGDLAAEKDVLVEKGCEYYNKLIKTAANNDEKYKAICDAIDYTQNIGEWDRAREYEAMLEQFKSSDITYN